MSTTVANTLRMNAICSVYSEGRPMSVTGSVQSERQSQIRIYLWTSNYIGGLKIYLWTRKYICELKNIFVD